LIAANLVGPLLSEIKVGQAVEVVFERHDGVTLPQFRYPAETC
jgi:hypothetical protein